MQGCRRLSAWVVALAVAAIAAPEHMAAGHNEAKSSGWIAFDFQDGKRIFIPATVNGHKAEILLATGLPVPDIDKSFAASIGLQPEPNPGDKPEGSQVHDLDIGIGTARIRIASASLVDFAALSKHIGHALPVLLGDDALHGYVVDIDFQHHRIALRNPAGFAPPQGAAKLALVSLGGEHLVPVSIEGAAPAYFEMGLGNSGEMLVYQSYYEPHHLLENRKAAKRMAAGSGGFIVETVADLRSVGFAGIAFQNVAAAFIPTAQTGATSTQISGDLGLPVLTRFRLAIDYPHNLLYAVPNAAAAQAPFAKNRLGLFLKTDETGVSVQFVAPDSPAEAAGLKVGDKIAQIDGRPAKAWPAAAIADLGYRAKGTLLAIETEDGKTRQIRLDDYF